MPFFRFLLTSVCLSVHGLAPLPFDLESWFFACALVLAIGKSVFFKFLNFFFYWVKPLFRFLTTSACLSVHGLTPLPFILESWFFAWALVLAIGKNGFSNFLFFLFFYWVMPLFRFLLTSVCLSVHGLAPLPLDLESWFFAWALVMGLSKNVFFKFLNFYFFTELGVSAKLSPSFDWFDKNTNLDIWLRFFAQW